MITPVTETAVPANHDEAISTWLDRVDSLSARKSHSLDDDIIVTIVGTVVGEDCNFVYESELILPASTEFIYLKTLIDRHRDACVEMYRRNPAWTADSPVEITINGFSGQLRLTRTYSFVA